ncbi:MAG: tripartite tricarboxylate transporter substrate binding protein [Planctomycetes bacterium]|nr:tripartite tricarboxylate transporter substrate binding protein [Planctomycetota bacterium]
MTNWRAVGIGILALAVVAAGGVASSLEWPTGPIEIVVPNNPGGDNDRNARIFAKYLEQELGQRVIIINMAGAGSTIGMNNVMNARPDGYRGIFYHSGGLIAKIIDMTDYTLTEAFAIAAIPVIDKSNAFVSRSDAPFNDIAELVEYARQHPGDVSFGTETGTFSHLHILVLADTADADFNIVDAGTASEKVTALLGGRLDVIGTQYGLVQQYIDSGEFKCIGILAEDRLPGADAKTFREVGYDIVFDKVFFIGFPKDTDPAIIATFNEASRRVAENPDYIEECGRFLTEPAKYSPEEATAYLDSLFALYNRYGEALTK